MIAPLRTNSLDCSTESAQEKFLKLLPQIRQQAMFAFRGLRTEAREELAEEVVANSFCAFAQLVRRGKAALAYATPLAQYAIRQIRAGRRVGGRLNMHDIMSPHARCAHRLTIERLEQRDDRRRAWNQLLVEDFHTPVDKQAAFRIDFPVWLSRLAPRQRRIAEFLAAGNSTSQAACRFRLSAARISQLRQDFHRDWLRFHGELPVVRSSAVAA